MSPSSFFAASLIRDAHLRDLMAEVRAHSPQGQRVLEAYAAGDPLPLDTLKSAEDFMVAVQGAALMGDQATFHQLLDQSPVPLDGKSWPADVFHPFYLAHREQHSPHLFERVADAAMILALADNLSNHQLTQVDPWLAAGVMAGCSEPLEQWNAVMPGQFPQAEAAIQERAALVRLREAEATPPPAAGRRRLRS